MKTSKTTEQEQFLERLLYSEKMFLKNEMEGIVYKKTKKGYFARLPGGEEFQVSVKKSSVLAETLMDPIEITEEEYENF